MFPTTARLAQPENLESPGEDRSGYHSVMVWKWLERAFGSGGRAGPRPPAPAAEPFPPAWLDILDAEVEFYPLLPDEDRPRLHARIAEFIAAKRFWGSQGLEVTERMKVIVAAYAALLVLKIPAARLYPRTAEVIIYPGEFGETVDAVGPDGRVYVIKDMRAGEAHHRGPVLLAWGSIEDEEGLIWGDVIIHEFAHALDELDGVWDGAPAATGLDPKEWSRIFSREFEALRKAESAGRRTFIDPYGAGHPAEFFAVVSEHFFLEPRPFRRRHGDLYAQLAAFYRQDPAAWRQPATLG